MIFLRIDWPNLVQFTQQMPIGDQNILVSRLRRTDAGVTITLGRTELTSFCCHTLIY